MYPCAVQVYSWSLIQRETVALYSCLGCIEGEHISLAGHQWQGLVLIDNGRSLAHRMHLNM